MDMEKSSGVLLPIFSLPSSYGIGSFGEEAKKFVDFLVKAKQTYWQILPLNHPSFGDCPYSCYSTYAGNPYLIDLEKLNKDGLINNAELKKQKVDFETVDYEYLDATRMRILKKAANRFIENDEYRKFCDENDWLDDYCLFLAIKERYENKDWLHWPNRYRARKADALNKFKDKYGKTIREYKVIQYFFYTQWNETKKYANDNGIQIIGDIPFYVAMDSCDVWVNQNLFEISKSFVPKNVAGVAPDYFSQEGQMWGNPLYKWKLMKQDNYAWWIKRIKQQRKLYDVIRIDHFRGFDSYYAIPYGNVDGRIGTWKKGPGYNFFKILKQECEDIEIIAEDLGLITDSVRRLVKRCKYPGMKVLEFAFGSDDLNPYLPHNVKYNSVIYCGTHDNDTVVGWWNSLDDWQKRRVYDYIHSYTDENINYKLIELMMSCKSKIAIMQFQDLLGLDSKGRINVPGVAKGNWKWMAKDNDFNDELASKVALLTKKYKRC